MWLTWLSIALLLMLLSAYVGYWYRIQEEHGKVPFLSHDYLAGINFIINDEPDKAVDHFIKMLAVDSDTVETHLALGKLFRRRGEVDRAIRIHQNLIARPTLDHHYRAQSLLALGCDYLSAGMLDRAERIFLELVKEKVLMESAFKMLLDIYQQEKAWQKAIETAMEYQVLTKTSQHVMIAHFYCELAEQALQRGDLLGALSLLDDATKTDMQSVRARLLRGQCLMKQNKPEEALNCLKQIEEKDQPYFADALPLIVAAYESLQRTDELQTYLDDVANRHPSIGILNVFASVLQKQRGETEAAAFVKHYVHRHPSLSGVVLYLQLTMSSLQGQTRDDLFLLQTILKKMLKSIARYQCHSCGFSGNTLHWLCPGCKQWGSVLPIAMYEDKPAQ